MSKEKSIQYTRTHKVVLDAQYKVSILGRLTETRD